MPGGRPWHRLTELERFDLQYTPEPMSGCWLWTGAIVGQRRYGGMWFRGRNDRAHRISWKLFRGEIPDGLHVLHKCDVKTCVNPDHLFLGTNADNMADMTRKGRQMRGERSPRAVLTEAMVRDIRRRPNERICDLAAELGVSRLSVFYVRHRQTWRHVETEEQAA